MHQNQHESQGIELIGTLRLNELEGGSWQLELDEMHDQLGMLVVMPSWTPSPPLTDGSRVRAHVRMSEAQFGIIMAGPHVDVLRATLLTPEQSPRT